MREIYDLAHQLIDMAENGASLNEIADKLMRQKKLNEDYIEPGFSMIVKVPVKINSDELSTRYPLVMVNKHNQDEVAVSWVEEQRLRRLGYLKKAR